MPNKKKEGVSSRKLNTEDKMNIYQSEGENLSASTKLSLANEISAILFILLALLTGFILYFSPISNGILGDFIHSFLLGIIGPASYILPLLFFAWGLDLFLNRRREIQLIRSMHFLILIILISAIWQCLTYSGEKFERLLWTYVNNVYVSGRATSKIEATTVLQFLYSGSIDRSIISKSAQFTFGGVIGSCLSLGLNIFLGFAGTTLFLIFAILIELLIIFDFTLKSVGMNIKQFVSVAQEKIRSIFYGYLKKRENLSTSDYEDYDYINVENNKEALLTDEYEQIRNGRSSPLVKEDDEYNISYGNANMREIEFSGQVNTLGFKQKLLRKFGTRNLEKFMASKDIFPFFTYDDKDKHKIIKQNKPKNSSIIDNFNLSNTSNTDFSDAARRSSILEHDRNESANTTRSKEDLLSMPDFLNQRDVVKRAGVPDGKNYPDFLLDVEYKKANNKKDEAMLSKSYDDSLDELLIGESSINRHNHLQGLSQVNENNEVSMPKEAHLDTHKNHGSYSDEVKEWSDKENKVSDNLAVNSQSGQMQNFKDMAHSAQSRELRKSEKLASEAFSKIAAERNRTNNYDEHVSQRLHSDNSSEQIGNIKEIREQNYFSDAIPDYLNDKLNNDTQHNSEAYLTGDGVLSDEEKDRARSAYIKRQNELNNINGLNSQEPNISKESLYISRAKFDVRDKEQIKSFEHSDNEVLENKNDRLTSEFISVENGNRIDLTHRDKSINKSATNYKSHNEVARKEVFKSNSIRPYVFPPLSLLSPANPNSRANRMEIEDTARKLVALLQSFGVETSLSNITSGPTITRFELTPGVGVRVNKILNLSEDIALGLAATGLRIEAPIPGRSAVGIEIPNRVKETVYLRPLLESKEFQENKSMLAAPIGRDIPGEAIICDISKMPHLLVAGATGSGKSVCINAILISLLFRATPKDLRLILIDPKVVELSLYNGIPHLLTPVVTDPQKAANTLNWAVQEMDRRYKLFAKTGCKDLARYNAAVDKKLNDRLAEREEMYQLARRNDPLKSEEEIRELVNASLPLPADEHLALILIVIDELADLMAAAHQDVETSIARLTAKARAAGMHLIIATQRPSVDVITGTIKANTPSRLAFAVSSQVDSRTILDRNGAETLLGKGDMLYHPLTENKAKRGQAALVSDSEAEAVVEFIKANNTAEVNEELSEEIQGANSQLVNSNTVKDELYDEAVEVVLEVGSASASVLQRRLNIGYPRAARLIDTLEDDHIIGPHEGSKPRKLKITRDEWEEIKSSRV